MIKVIDR